MHNMTVRASAFRGWVSGGARGTIDKIRSSHLMQEMVGGFYSSQHKKNSEHFEPYGFTSAIISRNADGVAEAMMSFMGGDAAHAIAGVIGDRRYRPRGLQEGENAQYDDQGQMTLLKRDATYMISHDGNGESTQSGTQQSQQGGGQSSGGSQSSGQQQQQKQRFVSVRHVADKQKQPKPTAIPMNSPQADQMQQQNDQQAQQYKHEGEINNEMRVDKNFIKFQTGDGKGKDTDVGHYDKQKNQWVFNIGDFSLICDSKQVVGQYKDTQHGFRVDSNHAHIRFGDNSIWVDSNGCWSSSPIQLKSDGND
jgi:hypothetical protein